MNIQKEVEKFEVKKAKLVSDFVGRMTKLIHEKFDQQEQIDSTVKSLHDQKATNDATIKEAQAAIRKA